MQFTPCLLMLLGLLILSACAAGTGGTTLPDPSQLAAQPALPDPLTSLYGKPVTTKREWYNSRRPELRSLFEYYMYGQAPAATKVSATLDRSDKGFLNGRATLKEITLRYEPTGTPPIHLLLILPNDRRGPVPIFAGLNFCGNHGVTHDPGVRLNPGWMYDRYPGVVNNRATEASRGHQADRWQVEQIVSRGYGLATAYSGDIDPDKHDWTDGVHPHFYKPGQTQPAAEEWGTIAAWAWGLSRMMDYLVTDQDVDRERVAVVGHSRLGKTALLAAAFDDRFAMSIPIQAGCGGTAPSRGKVGESVLKINTNFPHWFCDNFTLFNDQPEKLPFDQHGLVAMVAPRPVLFLNAKEDEWANPAGQFDVLVAASPVYRLLGVEGVASTAIPPIGTLMSSRLGYFIRNGKHEVTGEDWKAMLDYADQWLR